MRKNRVTDPQMHPGTMPRLTTVATADRQERREAGGRGRREAHRAVKLRKGFAEVLRAASGP